MPICDCLVYCRGGKGVSERTYRRHANHRDPVSSFTQELGALLAQRHDVPVRNLFAT